MGANGAPCAAKKRTTSGKSSAPKPRSGASSRSNLYRWLARRELAGTLHNRICRGFTLTGRISPGSMVLTESLANCMGGLGKEPPSNSACSSCGTAWVLSNCSSLAIAVGVGSEARVVLDFLLVCCLTTVAQSEEQEVWLQSLSSSVDRYIGMVLQDHNNQCP